MGSAVVIVFILGVLFAISKWRQGAGHASADVLVEGHVRHLRTANFPCPCSWCRNTTLARKLMIYERAESTWRVRDVHADLAVMPSEHVQPTVDAVFRSDVARWRRFCSEKCVKEFLAAERSQALEEFVPCAYCAFRYPMMVTRCTNCGAGRTG